MTAHALILLDCDESHGAVLDQTSIGENSRHALDLHYGYMNL